MVRDNDAYVRSVSNNSLTAPLSPLSEPEEDADEPREEDVAAFDRVFAQFDPNNLGVVSMRDFLAIIDELDSLRPKSAKPLLTEVQREQSLAFTSAEGGTAEMTRNQLFEFIKEMTGNKIIVASPKKKKDVERPKEVERTPTKSEVARSRLMLPGSSAKSQVRGPQRRRRGDLEKMAENTTNLINPDESFSKVPVSLKIQSGGIAPFSLQPKRTATAPSIVTSTPMPFGGRSSSFGDEYEGLGMRPMSPTSPIGSPPLKPVDWTQDKGVQEYISDMQVQADDQIKRLQDQERLSNARLREQDILITELQEKADAAEDELKERKRELGELRAKDSRMMEVVRSMEKEVESRENELSLWRDRYQNVKKSYDEQLSEADKLRDMILTKEGENNLLKEKITSLQEDIDTFVRVSWQFAGERQTLHDTIAKLERELSGLRKTEYALEQKEMEARQLTETVERLKFDLEAMRKRASGSEQGTMRSDSIRSLLGNLGRSDSVKMKPDILAHELAQDERKEDSDDDGYIETVIRKSGKEDKASAMQVFSIEVADQGVQATPSTQTQGTQTAASLENTLANILREGGDEDSLRRKIDALTEGLGSQSHLLDELVRKSKLTESSILSESAVIRKHGPPPPYEIASSSTSRWPKFFTVAQDGEVATTGWVVFVLWSLVLFLVGLTTQSIIFKGNSVGELFPNARYATEFEMFGQRHWWEKWGMDTPWGRLIWKLGWHLDEMLRGDGGWPS